MTVGKTFSVLAAVECRTKLWTNLVLLKSRLKQLLVTFPTVSAVELL